MTEWSGELEDADATATLGATIARALSAGVVALHGDLGAGKTTLVRGLLRARGVSGAVRSPTYTLVEPYNTPAGMVYHLDLYRLGDPEELYFLGVEELSEPGVLALIEWPERGCGVLPAVDLSVHLSHQGDGRRAWVQAHSEPGRGALEALDAGWRFAPDI